MNAFIICRRCGVIAGVLAPGWFGRFLVKEGQELHCKECDACSPGTTVKEDDGVELEVEELEAQRKANEN